MHWDLNPEPLTTKANFLAAVFSVNLVCKEELIITNPGIVIITITGS